MPRNSCNVRYYIVKSEEMASWCSTLLFLFSTAVSCVAITGGINLLFHLTAALVFYNRCNRDDVLPHVCVLYLCILEKDLAGWSWDYSACLAPSRYSGLQFDGKFEASVKPIFVRAPNFEIDSTRPVYFSLSRSTWTHSERLQKELCSYHTGI